MGRFMVTIDVRYLDNDDNEVGEFSTCADGESAAECVSLADSEMGTNVYDWMREKETIND